MKLLHPIILAILLTQVSCGNIKSPGEREGVDRADQLYADARGAMQQADYDSAMVSLETAFGEGLEHPMRIVSDRSFYYLVDDPEYRKKVRTILKKYAHESHATMVRDEEPGTPLVVTGRILNESNGLPVGGVVVELVQADSTGLYFSEKSTFNPRLFAYLKTDMDGRFIVRTIRPGSYLDDHGNPVPAHIHFTLEKEGFRVYASEFTFEDDPIFMEKGDVDNIPVAKRITQDGQMQYDIDIYLQRDR